MKRHTIKIHEGVYAINGDESNYLKNGYMLCGDTINKLGMLEDIEEELGIELADLRKANKKIWVRNDDGSIEEVEHYYDDGLTNYLIDLDSKAIYFTWYGNELNGDVYPFEEYGKTWALTEDELKTLS